MVGQMLEPVVSAPALSAQQRGEALVCALAARVDALEGLVVSSRPDRGTTVPAEFGLSASEVHVEADAAGARRGLGDKTLVVERLLASMKRRRVFKGR